MTQPESGDIWGGLSSAIVILPQAMAFGVALWSQFGGDVASGAMAGLIAAAALSLMSGISGGTYGMVSAPTGPTFVLLGGTMLALQSSGLAMELLPEALVLMLLLTGMFQLLIGVFNVGHLIKFIPYPVTAGFMTGSALLMIFSQWQPITGTQLSDFLSGLQFLPLLTAALTFTAMIVVPRWLPMIPGTVAGLVCGTLSFYLLLWITPGDMSTHWVIGQLPAITSINVGFSFDALEHIPWEILIAASLALAVLASLDTLLTSVVADVTTGSRHHARQELIGQGVGQMLSGLFGGMSGAGTTGASVIAANSGGRRWVGVAASGTILFFLLFVGNAAAYLPVSVLAGIILHVAIMGMIERNIFAWLRRRRTRIDGVIAVSVTLVTVAYDLMVAVGVGVLIAMIQFVRAQIKAPVIRARTTAAQRSSLRRRPELVRDLLAEKGEQIIRYELQGNLFFGTVDRLFTEMADDLERPNWIILDMARVTQVDLTAARLFQQMASRLNSHGGELIFTTVRGGKGLGRKVEKTFRKINPHGKLIPIRTFIDADESLEYAEDSLLQSLDEAQQTAAQAIGIEEIELCKDLTSTELAELSKVLRKEQFAAGDILFHSGDPGDELFIVLRGEMDAILPYGTHHYKRLATFGPGTFLGEVCFLKQGTRTAEVRVTQETELLVLDKEGFQKLQNSSPSAAISILTALGQALSEHLRWADIELQRMID